MELANECVMCGQAFLFEMNRTCEDCEKETRKRVEEEMLEKARADLFDETCSDLPPFFPWGRMHNRGFTAHSMRNPLDILN